MNTTIQKLLAFVKSNILIHGVIMAIIGAIAKMLYPIIDLIQNGQAYTLPSFDSIWHVALAAAGTYFFKQLTFGSSTKQIDAPAVK